MLTLFDIDTDNHVYDANLLDLITPEETTVNTDRTADRAAYAAILTDRYADEIAALEALGTTGVAVTFTGGTCNALQAFLPDGRKVLATNGDCILIGPDHDAEYGDLPIEWSVALYTVDDVEGDELDAAGYGPDLAAAYAAALDHLAHGGYAAE